MVMEHPHPSKKASLKSAVGGRSLVSYELYGTDSFTFLPIEVQ